MSEYESIVWKKPLVSQNGSLYIGIPKTWVILHNLEKGDAIELKLLKDGNLKILAPKNQMDGQNESN